MNERIILNFVEFTPLKAQCMLEAARAFAVQNIDRRHGRRNGVVYAWRSAAGSLTVDVWWTGARAVVVKEVEVTP